MRIRIFARSFFEAKQGKAKEAYWVKHYRIISINSIVLPEMPPFTQSYWDCRNLLILFFDDYEHESSNAFSRQDAEKVIDFALQSDPRPILIHCTAGESRSGAVGLFLNKIVNRNCPQDSQRFFKDYPWIFEKANQLVLRRLEDAYAQKFCIDSPKGGPNER